MTDFAEKSIFLAALEHESPAERERYVRQACDGDAQLRRAVDDLLAAHGRTDSPLDRMPRPIGEARAQWEAASLPDDTREPEGTPAKGSPRDPEGPGTCIGPYTLRELIGEGGFGQVFVAEQRHPVRRKVALKVVKPGMDSQEVIARFEAERQALALMEHPHIAHVFDAGTTDTGRPYFVMELVRGIAITQFCEENELPADQRLELFIDVCHAVQHAHQKGVIHRDLKPSNVLVTLHDGRPVVKVIDFGIAKAISDPLAAKTIYTRFAQVMGTPLYMSPEQVALSALDVDTRSDIYSLGVLLYELLTGTTPFDQERLQGISFDELRWIIREEDPPCPSARLTTLGKAASTASDRRLPPRLTPLAVRGDLDWIVMRALEKDRVRRYQTAAEFAADVRCCLDQEPVSARPPSALYRFSKFARRHKAFLTTASLVLTALVLGTAVSSWQALRATSARMEAESLRQEAVDSAERLKQANVLFDNARANADNGRWQVAYQQHTQAVELQPDHYPVWSGRAGLFIRLGLWEHAAGDYARALALGAPVNNPGWWGVPQLAWYAGDARTYRAASTQMLDQFQQSADWLSKSIALRGCLVAPVHPDVDAQRLVQLAESLWSDVPAGRREGSFPGGVPRGPARKAPPGASFGPPGPHRPPAPPPGASSGGFVGPPLPREVVLYVAGLAHLRAGQFDQAVTYLQQAVPSGSHWPIPAPPLALPALALAYHHADQAAAAADTLARVEQSYGQWVQFLQESPLGAMTFPWFDWIEFRVLYREASLEITGRPLPVDPRLETLAQRALAAIEAP